MPYSGLTRWVTEGLIISGLSAYVYALAYYYERGCAAHFRIPISFITIEISSIAYVVLGVVLASFLIIGHMIQVKRLISSILDDTKPLKREILPVIINFLIALSIPIIAMIKFKIIGPILLLITIYVFTCFIEYSVLYLKHKSSNRYTLFQFFRIVFYIFMMLIGIVVSEGMGGFCAQSRVCYTIIRSSPELAILKKYGDYLFCSQFDSKTNQLLGDMKLLRLSKFDKLDLFEARIGPLSPTPEEVDSITIEP